MSAGSRLLVVIGVVVVGISLLDLPFASGSNHGRGSGEGDRRSILLVARSEQSAVRNARSALRSAQSMSTMGSAFTTHMVI